MEICQELSLLLTLGLLVLGTIGQPPIGQYQEEQEVLLVGGSNNCNVELDFSNMGLSSIKKNFITGPSIRKLSLRDNEILEFQDGTFENLPNLEHLDISRNNLRKEKLFSFGSVPSLKTLILDDNVFMEDESTDIQCSNYPIDYRTQWGCPTRPYSNLDLGVEFPEVTQLSLRNIFMDSISNDWDLQFPKILALDVSQNRLSTPDEFIGNLPLTMENLTMQNAGLTSLRLKRPKNLTSLDLSSNDFGIISSNYCYGNTLCLKNVDELTALYVDSCSVKRIESDTFKDTQRLLHLDLSDNKLNEIPDGTFGFLPSLSHLDISRNNFTRIPDISILKNLKSVKMDKMGNHHLFIISLNSMSPMPNLQAISLRDNELKYLPSDFFTKFQGLQEIDLSDNQLTLLSPGPWQKNVKKLHLNYNSISNIEDLNLDQATSLELLELEGNNITNIKLSAVKKLPDAVVLKL